MEGGSEKNGKSDPKKWEGLTSLKHVKLESKNKKHFPKKLDLIGKDCLKKWEGLTENPEGLTQEREDLTQ